jgi:curli biogenesis system outer membrane secretion channel CsgG
VPIGLLAWRKPVIAARRHGDFVAGLAGLLALAACATPAPPQQPVEAPAAVGAAAAAQAQQPPAVPTLKRKVAIGRFTNETLYGRALLSGRQLDAMGRQVGDTLSTQLVETGRFIVLERPDLVALHNERVLAGITDKLPGANALIVGSLTEFGRTTEGQSGFLSRTKTQTARAKVNLRLVDPRTGVVVFATNGTGTASTESGTVAGFGSTAAYDETLNDRAIAAAVAGVMNELVNRLEENPWWSDILEVQGNQVVISGGRLQGLAPGQELAVMRRGKTIVSRQTGFPIELPPTPVGRIQVVETFGSSITDEGSVATVVQGKVPAGGRDALFVANRPGGQ